MGVGPIVLWCSLLCCVRSGLVLVTETMQFGDTWGWGLCRLGGAGYVMIAVLRAWLVGRGRAESYAGPSQGHVALAIWRRGAAL
jgi:hypothetical protein